MNPTGFQQTLGNVCVGVAAILYAIPLQLLLRDLSRKRDDGGAVIAGLIVLVPMWLLLIVGLLCVTTGGGFNGLTLNRTLVHVLAVLATAIMAVVSMLRFEFARNSSTIGKVIGGVPIHLFPVLTILLVVVSLNARIANVVPLQFVTVSWAVIAAFNLVVGGGFVGYKVVKAGANQVAGIGSTFGRNSELERQNLALIPQLDPERDFTELARLVSRYQSAGSRTAALEQLRRNNNFVPRLVIELTNATPSSGEAEHALEVVKFATFTPEEQKLMALPARSAMERITRYTREELRYFTKDRLEGARDSGSELFRTVGEKLASTGVDFRTAIADFERTFGR